MKKHYSLKSKLFILGAVISTLSFFMGGSNYHGLTTTSDSFRHVTSINLPNTELLGTMASEYRSVRIHLRTLGIEGITPAAAENEITQVKKAIQNYEVAAAAYEEGEWAPGEEQMYKELKDSWVSFKAIGGKVLGLYAQGGTENMKKVKEIFFKDCPEAAAVFDKEINDLFEYQKAQSKSWVTRAEADAHSANVLSIVLIAIQMTISLGIAFTMGRSLNQVFGNITEKLTHEADEVAKAAERISQTSGDLSSSANDQASALQETASAIAEVSAMVSKNADNAARSTEVTRRSSEQTERGKQSVQTMIQSISEIGHANQGIVEQVENSNRQMTDMVKVIHEIGEKTKVINDIVFQTKLLSFNASVEAARAGEHGKGFAVVAEEVGNLAQMSGNAAREISDMLQKSSEHVEKIAQESRQKVEILVRETTAKVEQGISISRECGETFETIVTSVAQVSQMVSEIAAGSREQSQGVSEIMKAIHQMDQVTQKNAASSQSAAADSHQLTEEAQVMREVVSELNLVVKGGVQGSREASVHEISDGSHSMIRRAA